MRLDGVLWPSSNLFALAVAVLNYERHGPHCQSPKIGVSFVKWPQMRPLAEVLRRETLLLWAGVAEGSQRPASLVEIELTSACDR